MEYILNLKVWRGGRGTETLVSTPLSIVYMYYTTIMYNMKKWGPSPLPPGSDG